jgi:hypothetical protein
MKTNQRLDDGSLLLSNSLTDLRERLKNEHAAVLGSIKTSLTHAFACGDILLEAKTQVKHGQWLPWLETCGISERTAQRYMRLARNREAIQAKSDNVSDLSVSGALTLLSPPGDDVSASLAQNAADSAFDQFELEIILARLESYRNRKDLWEEAKAALDRIGDLHLGQPQEQQPSFGELIENGPEANQLIVACQLFVSSSIDDPDAASQTVTNIRDIAVAWLTRVEGLPGLVTDRPTSLV